MTDEKGLDFESVRRLAIIEVFKEIDKEIAIVKMMSNNEQSLYHLENLTKKLKKKFGVD